MRPAIFSKFLHTLEVNNDTIAYYNALYKKPIFIQKSKSADINDAIHEGKINSDIEKEFNLLFENHSLVSSSTVDRAVLEQFQRAQYSQTNLDIAYFVLTDKCNFNCPHCFVLGKKKATEGTSMSLTQVSTYLDYFTNISKRSYSNSRTIIMYGGEPLLNKKALFHLLDEIKRHQQNGTFPQKKRLILNTNGVLLKKEDIIKLKSHGVTIAVSLDGDETVNDKNRKFANSGLGTFHAIKKKIDLCIKLKAKIGLSTTVTPAFLDKQDEMLDFLSNFKGLHGVSFNYLRYNPEFTTEKYYRDYSEFIIKAFKLFRNIGLYEDSFGGVLSAFQSNRVPIPECGAAGAGQIVFLPNNRVGFCQGLISKQHEHFINYPGKTLNITSLPYYSMWKKRMTSTMQDCSKCIALGICGGGCLLDSMNTGNIMTPFSSHCYIIRNIVKWLIRDLYEQMHTTVD